MYIPTQEERYSKVAKITLFLCVIAPSAVVARLGQVGDILTCLCGFLYPIALPLNYTGLSQLPALCISALLQACIFFWLVRSRTLTPKGKVTLAITWGMLFALILRFLIAFEVWLNATSSL